MDPDDPRPLTYEGQDRHAAFTPGETSCAWIRQQAIASRSRVAWTILVGDTLIISKPGYLVNTKYRISGDEMIVSEHDFSADLKWLK